MFHFSAADQVSVASAAEISNSTVFFFCQSVDATDPLLFDLFFLSIRLPTANV